MNIITKPCAVGNWHVGRYAGARPEAIVVHVMDGFLVGTDALFNTPPERRAGTLNGLASSAHYGIDFDGTIHQYVKDTDTAYHAGRVANPTWLLLSDIAHRFLNPNIYTIGIEHAGFADPAALAHFGEKATPWTDAQTAASVELIASLCSKYGIPADRDHIVGHHEIYSYKPCPGAACPLDDLVARAAAAVARDAEAALLQKRNQ